MPHAGALARSERLEAGWTQEALAAAIGCSKGQLSLMETGQRTLTRDWAARIEQALAIDDHRLQRAASIDRLDPDMQEAWQRNEALVDELRQAMTSGDPLDRLRQLMGQPRHQQNGNGALRMPALSLMQVPVINKVAAGYPTEFTDLGYPARVADEYVACPMLSPDALGVHDPDVFAARVIGSSMEPAYRDGEIVIFSPAAPTPPGSDCFVRFEHDDETTFKRVLYEDEGDDLLRLQPLNDHYPARVVRREEVAGMYAAVYVLRKV